MISYLSGSSSHGSISLDTSLNDYQVKKTMIGYECTNNEDKFRVKYQPIAIHAMKIIEMVA